MSEQSKGQVIGYARVSAADQNLGRQTKALEGCDRVFADKLSGKNTDRAQLQEMLRYVRDGDTLRVTSPDRLARSTRDLLSMVEDLKGRGVSVEFLDNPALNTDTPNGWQSAAAICCGVCPLNWRTVAALSIRLPLTMAPSKPNSE